MHQALYSGARMAVRLARDWERYGDVHEAKRARERAAYYLRSRRWILNGLNEQRKDAQNVYPET